MTTEQNTLGQGIAIFSTISLDCILRVNLRKIHLTADNWDLIIVLDSEGQVTSETQIIFDLVFEDQIRTVRCRPGEPANGTMNITTLGDSGEIAGSFDIEISKCEDAETGTPLGWPSSTYIARKF